MQYTSATNREAGTFVKLHQGDSVDRTQMKTLWHDPETDEYEVMRKYVGYDGEEWHSVYRGRDKEKALRIHNSGLRSKYKF